MPKILVSACLLGHKVRYDGKDNLQTHARLQSWIQAGEVITICPEMAGDLPTPRPPAEIQTGRTALEVLNNNAQVLAIDGRDVTEHFRAGAYKTLALAQKHNIHVAILTARSPSCGSSQVYDGTFSRILVAGMGVTSALLRQHGIEVFDETQIDAALDKAEFY